MDGVGDLIRRELQMLGQSHLHRCSDFDIERLAISKKGDGHDAAGAEADEAAADRDAFRTAGGNCVSAKRGTVGGVGGAADRSARS
jgi:hypothetical protein